MYNTKFIAELFRCQQIYSMQATRQIFDRLAHSSIMRLNESSMDKARPAATSNASQPLHAPVAHVVHAAPSGSNRSSLTS